MLLRNRKYLFLVLGALFSGLLLEFAITAATTSYFAGALSFICLIPLFVAMEFVPSQLSSAQWQNFRKSREGFIRHALQGFLLCWITGITFYLASCYWMINALTNNLSLSNSSAYFSYILYSVFYSLCFPAILFPFIFLMARNSKKSASILILFSLSILSSLLEINLPRFWHLTFSGFVNTSQALNQFNSFLGASALTPFLLFTNILIAKSIFSQSGKIVRIISTMIFSLVMWLLLFGIGSWRVMSYNAQVNKAEKTNIMVVQLFAEIANRSSLVAQAQAMRLDFNNTLQILSEGVKQLSPSLRPSLILLPESTSPYDILSNTNELEKLKKFSTENNIPIMLETREQTFKTAFLIRPDGSKSESIYQCNLLPFIQTIPFNNSVPFIENWISKEFPEFVKLSPKCAYKVLSFSPDFGVSPSIGFDVLSSTMINKKASNAEVFFQAHLVDETFSENTQLSTLFRTQAALRTIELGKPFLFASSVNNSLAFNAVGDIITPEASILNNKVLLFRIPMLSSAINNNTVFVAFGEYLWSLLAFISFGLLTFFTFRKHR